MFQDNVQRLPSAQNTQGIRVHAVPKHVEGPGTPEDVGWVLEPFVQSGPVEHYLEILLHTTVHTMEFDWYKLGRPLFKVWPGMVDALAHTSIDVETERFNTGPGG